MHASFSESSRGFSLLEMLVAISVVLLLSGITLGGLRAFKTHKVVSQAGSRIGMLLELAKGVALSEGEPVYLVIADHESEPPGVPLRAYTLLRDLSDPELLHHWQFLPKDVVFAPDADADGFDLIGGGEPLARLSAAFSGMDQGSRVEGSLRVLLEISADGTFRTGSGGDLQPSSLLLERGYWFKNAKNEYLYQALHEAEENIPLDAVRLSFRPRSGMIHQQDAEEEPER